MNATATETGFVLWFRPSSGSGWEMVATTRTHTEAVAAIGTAGRRGGLWLILPADQGHPGPTISATAA